MESSILLSCVILIKVVGDQNALDRKFQLRAVTEDKIFLTFIQEYNGRQTICMTRKCGIMLIRIQEFFAQMSRIETLVASRKNHIANQDVKKLKEFL